MNEQSVAHLSDTDDDDNMTDDEMPAMIVEEEKSTEMPMNEFTVRSLELDNSDEVSFYAKLFNLSASLTELYASQGFQGQGYRNRKMAYPCF